MKRHLRDRHAKPEGKNGHTPGAIRAGHYTVCCLIAVPPTITDDIELVTCKACQDWYLEQESVKIRCVNDVGYEGRLTQGKVYQASIIPQPEDLIYIQLDDGTKGEVFGERFEAFEKFPKPYEHPFDKGRSDFLEGNRTVDDNAMFPPSLFAEGKASAGKTEMKDPVGELMAVQEQISLLDEVRALVKAKKIHIIDGRKILDGSISIDEALQNGKPKLKSSDADAIRRMVENGMLSDKTAGNVLETIAKRAR